MPTKSDRYRMQASSIGLQDAREGSSSKDASARRDTPSASRDSLQKVAGATATRLGASIGLGVALSTVVAAAFSGPFLPDSGSWQSFSKTATSSVTFLVVLLILNVQRQRLRAVALAIAELERAKENARKSMLRSLDDAKLRALRARVAKLARDRAARN